MLSKLSRSRSPRRHVSLKRFVRSTPKMRRKSRRFAVISAWKSTVPKLPVTEKKEGHQGSHHTSPTEAARSHDAQSEHTELTEKTKQAAKPKPKYLDWKPSEEQLRIHVVNKALSRWEEVCTFLNVTHEHVAAAIKNNPGNVQQAFFQCLMHWYSGGTSKPVNWESVLEALNASTFKEVAKNIQTELAAAEQQAHTEFGPFTQPSSGGSNQSAMSPVHWLDRSPEWYSVFEGYQQNEVLLPVLQPVESAYAQLVGNLAQQLHDIGESKCIRVARTIQHFLRKPMNGVRMGDMPYVPANSEKLYEYIAQRSNCLKPTLIGEVVKAICVDELSELWKDYGRELTKCLDIALNSGKTRKVSLNMADDLAIISVKVPRNPEQFPISSALDLKDYFEQSLRLAVAIFLGYTPSSTVLYFAIPKAAVPFMPSLLLSHAAQLKRLEVQKIVVFGYFAVDLEEAQAVALADVHSLTKLKYECEKHEELVASTYHELELSRSEAMAAKVKLESKEKAFSEERKLAENAKQFLEIHVEELEKKLKIESPGQYSKEGVIMQQLAKHFPLLPPFLEIGEKLPFTPYSTFSTVYSGTLEGEPVMVKTISHIAFEATGEMEDPETVVSIFAEEFRTLQALNHPQVLSLKEAFHNKASKQLMVVMETAKESLGLYLKARQGETSYQTQLQICSELISGVLFLYDRNPPIVHGNLNDANIMMTDEGIVKIDIGDSVLKCNPVNMLHLLPEGLRYLPSEAFTRSHTAEEETDVFSLGVLLLQIATQKAPCVEHGGVGLTPEAERRSDDLGELDDQHPLKPIILQCLQHFPRDRPKVALLCSQVQSLIDSEETFISPEQPESVKAKGNGISEDELERQLSLETQAVKLHASTDESTQQNDEPKVSGPESAVLPEEFAKSLSRFVDTVPKTFEDLEGIFQSFNEERKDIELALEALLKAVQSLDVLVNRSASLMSLEDYHPAPVPDAMDPGQPTASPSPPNSGGSQRLDDRDTCITHEQAIIACELDLWKRRFRKLLSKHSQLLYAHGMDVDEEMRSLSLSEDQGSISTSTPSQHSQQREVSAQQEELSCVREELSGVQEEYAQEGEEMRETLGRTTEEHLPLNEAKSLTAVKDTEHAYHKIENKHQLVQTTPEEFPPEHEMAKQEIPDEATGKKLDSLEEEWVKFEATARLVKQLKNDLESLRERANKKIKHHTQESLEEQKLEMFTTLHGIKQLKSLLEGLKERVAKKPVPKAAEFQMLQRETATIQEVEQTYMTQLLVAVEQLERFEEKENMQRKLDHANAIPINGENDPSESVQQQTNESHSPEKDPDIQDVSMKDAPRCGQIFQWDQLQPKWTHKCTRSAESDKHVALVDTSEVPLVAKPEECTDTIPDVSTVAARKEPTVATPEASTLATPQAHVVTDSLMEQHQLTIREVVERNASLEEDNSKLRRERSDLARRLSAVEREVQKLTENTSLEEDKSTMKRKMDDLARSLSTMENERVILEEDFRALNREKCHELDYVKQKLAAEEESNRVLLKRISSMDEKVAKTFNS